MPSVMTEDVREIQAHLAPDDEDEDIEDIVNTRLEQEFQQRMKLECETKGISVAEAVETPPIHKTIFNVPEKS